MKFEFKERMREECQFCVGLRSISFLQGVSLRVCHRVCALENYFDVYVLQWFIKILYYPKI